MICSRGQWVRLQHARPQGRNIAVRLTRVFAPEHLRLLTANTMITANRNYTPVHGQSRALDRRRKSIRSIRKITRTMELISTAQFKRAMDRATAAAAYTRRITALVGHLAHSGLEVTHPLLMPRPEPKRASCWCWRPIGDSAPATIRNILRLAMARYHELRKTVPEVRIEMAGKRGISAFRFRKLPLAEMFTHFNDKPSFAEVDVLASRYLLDFADGAIDRLDVVYTKFESVSRQQAVVETLLPLGELGERMGTEAVLAERQRVKPVTKTASVPLVRNAVRVPPLGREHFGRGRADQFQGEVVQVFSRRGRERADRADGGDEGRHRKRRQHDFAIVDGLQPRPARTDHRRVVGDHRRSGSVNE